MALGKSPSHSGVITPDRGYRAHMEINGTPEQPAQPVDAPQQDSVVETRYLDLDGDGVPDAVQTVEAIAVEDGVTGAPIVEVLEEVQTGIGIDGVPEQVAVVDDEFIELQPVDDESALA